MKNKLYWFFLFVIRAFSQTHKNILISVTIIFSLSLLPLSLIYVLTNGMIEGIYKRHVETLLYHAQIHSREESLDIEDIKKKSPFPIENIYKERQASGLLISNKKIREPTLLRGLDPNLLISPSFYSYFKTKENLTGSLFLEKNEIALGLHLAESLKVKTGDKINLISLKAFGRKYVPKLTLFKVKYIISTGYAELDKTWSLVSLKDQENLFDKRSPPIWGVKFKKISLKEIPSITNQLNNLISEIGWWISWQELNRYEIENFNSLKVIFFVLFSCIVLVACFNVSSSLIIYCIEEKQSIALLKSLGMTPHLISLSFSFMGGIIGLFGSILGISVSLIIVSYLNYLLKGILLFSQKFQFFIEILLNLPHRQSLLAIQETYYLIEIESNLPLTFIIIVVGVSIFLTTISSFLTLKHLEKIKPLDLLT